LKNSFYSGILTAIGGKDYDGIESSEMKEKEEIKIYSKLPNISLWNGLKKHFGKR
jgi:hypothetical protein